MKCILLSILVIGALLLSACAPEQVTVAQGAKEIPTPAPSAREVDLEKRVDELEQQVGELSRLLYEALPGYHMPWDTVGGRIGDLEGRVEALEDEVFGFRW